MSRNVKRINSLIKSIASGAKKQRADIHEALVEAAMFVFSDRNTDPAKRLFEAVGSGVYKAGMSKWLSLNAPVHFVAGVPSLSSDRQKEMVSTLTETEFEIKLREMPAWYDVDEVNNTSPNVWDGPKFMEKVAQYLDHAAKKAAKAGDEIAAKEIEASRMVLAAFLNNKQYDVKEIEETVAQ